MFLKCAPNVTQLGLLLFSSLLKKEVPEGNEPRLSEQDKLTRCLCESAIKNFPGRRIRTDMSDGDRDWEEDFYILRKSWCPAVLTENFFMDTHVEGIVEWLESSQSQQVCFLSELLYIYKHKSQFATEPTVTLIVENNYLCKSLEGDAGIVLQPSAGIFKTL